MKRRRLAVPAIGTLWLIAQLTGGCAAPERLSTPWFVEFAPNAYEGIEEHAGQVELDNPLLWHFAEGGPLKELEYYAFRVTLGASEEAEYRFFWLRNGGSGRGSAIRRVDGPCAEGDSARQLMRKESTRLTGNPDGPAAYSTAVAEMVESGGAVYWETTCELRGPLPQGDEKNPYLKNFTFLVDKLAVPGTLLAQLWKPARMGKHRANPLLGLAVSGLAGKEMVHSPFHLAAVGDSLMWGEGLPEDQKLWRRVSAIIEQETGQEVRPRSFAFAGAMVDDPRYEECWDAEALSGEVPHSRPDIRCQFESIAGFGTEGRVPGEGEGVVAGHPLPLERLDLLLMDGCANDIGPLDIEVGTGNGADMETLRRAIHCHCGETADLGECVFNETVGTDTGYSTDRLLQEVRARAPNAQVIVLGYFPILSADSTASCTVQTAIYGTVYVSSLVAGYVVAIGSGGVLGSEAAVITVLGTTLIAEGALRAWLEQAEKRNQLWVAESDGLLASAAERSNEAMRGIGAGSASFVPVSTQFHGHEAFVADGEPWLWELGCGLEPEDPVAGERGAACEARRQSEIGRVADADWRAYVCERSSAFHPNGAGEDEYVRLVVERLRAIGVLPPKR